MKTTWMGALMASLLVLVACPTGDDDDSAGVDDDDVGVEDDDSAVVDDDDAGDDDDSGWVPPEECALPNPLRAQVGADLEEPWQVLDDGSFELPPDDPGAVQIEAGPPDALTSGRFAADPAAARTGGMGWKLESGPGQGGDFQVKVLVDKAETVDYGFWARSTSGSPAFVELTISYENGGGPVGEELVQPVEIPADWTEIRVSNAFKENFEMVWFGLRLGPDVALHVDDFFTEIARWKLVEYDGDHATVGTIDVPSEPVAPVLFSILIHIEDPQNLVEEEVSFRQKSAVFEELSAIHAEHGGIFVIQPELEWALGSDLFDGGAMLGDLATEHGTVYSTHTHGPNCYDPDGVPQGSAVCKANQEDPTWDFASPITSEAIVQYVQTRVDHFEAASGIQVEDHNGNWDMGDMGVLADAGILTLTGFKNKEQQATFDELLTNPWRPSPVDALEEPLVFQTHDPDGEVIFVPGYGQNITKHHHRMGERLRRMFSQAIYYAEPGRVNSFNIVTHVDAFFSREGLSPSQYLNWSPTDGYTYSPEFEQHLAEWDDMFTEIIDPLVAAGYVQWMAPSDVGREFIAWEEACAGP